MPPRTVKRGGASGPKRSTRTTRGSVKQQPEIVEETVKEVSIKEEVKPVIEVDNKPSPLEPQSKSNVNALAPAAQSKLSCFAPLLK